MRVLRIVVILVLAGALDLSVPLVSEAREAPEELPDATGPPRSLAVTRSPFEAPHPN
jgi:hypothetical protein